VGRARFLIAFACLACASAPRRSAVDDQRAIGAALEDFHDAAARADEERYFAHFAPSGVFLGTDATERWDVAAFRAFSHPFFARGKAWAFRATRRAVVVRGETAWFDEDLATDTLGPARGSGVLVFRDGRWLIEQYVLSITVPNQRLRDVRELLESPGSVPPDTAKYRR
jgi:ketosteroid isomerase-like protein